MKNILLILIICCSLMGCTECEPITADLENDELPTDPDPDPVCQGTFYASHLTLTGEGDVATRSFVSYPKPANSPFELTTLEMLPGSGQIPLNQDGYNHAAYNKMSDRYAYGYQYGPGITNPLYIADTNPLASTIFTREDQYAAPVYNNNTMYVINVLDLGDDIDYTIASINENTGEPTVLFSGTENTTSPFNNSFISSTTDGGDMLYFIGFTTLVSYSISTNTATYMNIDMESNPSNQLLYYGLEYQQNPQRLLAIKERFNSPDLIAELVSISTDGGAATQSVYDIQSNLSAENDGTIFPQFYSTTFSQCDNVYHITELDEIDPPGFMLRSNLIDINVAMFTLNEIQIEGFMYGLEIDEN